MAFYSREDVQKELVRIAENREVQFWFGREKMGKRPDSVQFKGDVKEAIKRGMTSMHISVERWRDELQLLPGMKKKDLDDLRIGWDMLLDIDGKDFEFSRMVAELLVEALKFYDIEDYTVKFSGNKGFHIGVPFECFPDEVNGINIKDYFPDGLRVIAEFLAEKLKPFLTERVLEWKDREVLAKEYFDGDDTKLTKKGKFDVFTLVDIDSILISSRHLFRAPYVFNEKSGLVSVMVKDVKSFTKDMARQDGIMVDFGFLDREVKKKGSAGGLLVEAFDWDMNNRSRETLIKESKVAEYTSDAKREFSMPTVAIKEEFFPPCINKLLLGCPEDGRKRAVFMLINFLRSAGWDWEKVTEALEKWNEANYESLREGYIRSQISWAKKQNKSLLPPNCDNEAYYKGMGICCPDGLCQYVKNPVNYMLKRLNAQSRQKKKRVKKVVEKKTKKVAKKDKKEEKKEPLSTEKPYIPESVS